MRLLLVIWLTVGLLAVWAQDSGLYIRNRPFKGAFEGVGPTMLVELTPLVEALDLAVRETPDGGLVVGAPPDPEATCGAGTVVIGGQTVPITAGKVELAAFCAAAGARVTPNKTLGTIDVYPGLADAGGRALAPAKVSPDATPTQVVQGFFAGLRILEPLPALTDLLPFFRDPSRFVSSARLCEEHLKPLVTASGWTDLGNSISGMRSNLALRPFTDSGLSSTPGSRTFEQGLPSIE